MSDLVAAFANAQPAEAPGYAPAPPVEAIAAPEAAVEAPEVPAPAELAPLPVEAAAAPAVDYAAYLREQFGMEAPEAIKTALETARNADTLRDNQRTPEDIAFRKLFEDPAAGAAYLRLQHTDFSTLPDRELLAAKYAHDHPELKPEVAAIRARREYEAEYAAAAFDDPDDATVAEAKVLLAAARTEALQTMEQAKQAASAAVRSSAPNPADGPSVAELAAQAAEAERTTHWTQGVEQIVGAPSLEIEYTVDGQPVKLAFDNKSAAYKDAMLNPFEFIAKQVQPTGDWKQSNFDRMAEIIALITQPEVLAKNAYAAGRASLGAVIPLDRAVNPAPSAPQAGPGQDATHDSRVAAALRSEMARISQATYS